MIQLPTNFELDRYGLHVRFARKEDAEFIHALRTTPKNAPFLHVDGCSVETQREWLIRYKSREITGEEYYLVYEFRNNPIGVLRLCYIEEDNYHCSSWAFLDNQPAHLAIAGALIAREIAFEMLEKERELNWREGIAANNRNVISFMKLLGWHQTDERYEGETKFLTGVLKKEDFLKNKPKVLRFIPKDMQKS